MSNLEKIFHVDLDSSINSGQVFLWKKIGSKWYGVNGNDVIKCAIKKSGLEINNNFVNGIKQKI